MASEASTKAKIPTLAQIKAYFRASNYLAAAQIFLQGNYMLTRPLEERHVKARLLGHWGTCPGINFVYTHMNAYLCGNKQDFLYVVGPGHGFPAIQANTFMDGSLSHYHTDIPYNYAGMKKVIREFSWPYGYPSHVNPGSPGAILEGGELGYSLSTSYGSVLDNPNLVTVCLVGDGEAETGPTATAWHANKFINPKEDGAVLPILHLNEYKISGPTIFGRMSDTELKKLFEGYGYEVQFVDYFTAKDVHASMQDTLAKAMKTIHGIQKKARGGKDVERPMWPMIILRTPKGWSGIKELGDMKVENNHYSHQVIVKKAKTDKKERSVLESWLRGYKFGELYHPETGFIEDVKAVIPPEDRQIARSPYAHCMREKSLRLPDLKDLALDIVPGETLGLAMHKVGEYLREIVKLNRAERNFRLFSPDETYSNKLHAIFEETARQWQWPIKSHDEDLARDGRVIEMLSEHTLQGLMQGYTLTGRFGVFASYEAFLQIVASMMDQYAKFVKASFEFPWRPALPPFTYILSSLGWRQDHNGYSHQNPSFVSNALAKHGNLASVYFPVDANSALAVMEECLSDANSINLVVCGKQNHVQWLTMEQARKQVKAGLGIWEFASDPNPDLVFASAGDFPTIETLAAVKILRQEFPELKLRYVNVSEMTSLGVADPRSQTTGEDFMRYFTKDKHVIFNYHGYTSDVKTLLFESANCSMRRFHVHGYEEEGSTTSPFDMQVRNKTDRYHLVLDALECLKEQKCITSKEANRVVTTINKKLEDHKAYIITNGDDPKELTNWTWTS